MGQILRISFVRFLYSFIASMAAYISLWHGADMLQDKVSSGFRPGRSSYDFIVVGAGTAGSVVAHRLSKTYNVLLLEAGGDPYVFSHIPGFSFYLLNYPQIDWMHTTVPQRNACLALVNQESGWSQGKGLGGTSNINFMIHSRGHPKDYDNWARITGDQSWNYDGVLPYFRKMEDYHGDYSHSGLHGKDGPMRIALPPERGNADMFVRAGQDLGYEKVDLNGRFTQGFDSIYNFIKNGRRHGAYSAYIKPIRQKRTLTIEKFAQVNKIILDDKNVACGVEYVRHGQVREARATKEVILSAGAIQSPKILMLSGIGPKEHLESLHIEVKVDSPQVGKNVQDHISLYLGPFFVDQGNSLIPDRDIKVTQFIEYFSRGTGALTATGISAMGFFSSSIAKAAGEEDWPDIQLMYGGYGTYNEYPKHFAHAFHVRDDIMQEYHKNDLGKDSFVIITSLARPIQRGEILLRSSNPNEKLLIDPRYLQNEKDMRVLVEGVKKAVDLAEKTESFQKIRAKFTSQPFPGCERVQFRSDAYWECFIRQLSITLHHIVGSCAMGTLSSNSVVDSHLKVKGVKNLRVIDASVMPTVPIGNTNSPTVMIGERGADFILKHWEKVPASPSRRVFHRTRPFAFTQSSTTRRSSLLDKQSRNDFSRTPGNFNGKPKLASITSAPSPVPASQDNLENLLNIKTLMEEATTAKMNEQTEFSGDEISLSTTSRPDEIAIDWRDIDKSDRKGIESMTGKGKLSEATNNLNMMVTLITNANNEQGRNESELFNLTMGSSTESLLTTQALFFPRNTSSGDKEDSVSSSITEKSLDYYDDVELEGKGTGPWTPTRSADASAIAGATTSAVPAGVSKDRKLSFGESKDWDNVATTTATEDDYTDPSIWTDSKQKSEESMDKDVTSVDDPPNKVKGGENTTEQSNATDLTSSTTSPSGLTPTSLDWTSVAPTNGTSDSNKTPSVSEDIAGSTASSAISAGSDLETTISSEDTPEGTTTIPRKSEQEFESTLNKPVTSAEDKTNDFNIKSDTENATFSDNSSTNIKSELTEGATETSGTNESETESPEDILFGQDSKNGKNIFVLNLEKQTNEDTTNSSGAPNTNATKSAAFETMDENATKSAGAKISKTESTTAASSDSASTSTEATGSKSTPVELPSSSEKDNQLEKPKSTDEDPLEVLSKSSTERTDVSASITDDTTSNLSTSSATPKSSEDAESVIGPKDPVNAEPQTTGMPDSDSKPRTPENIAGTETPEIMTSSLSTREGKSFGTTNLGKLLEDGTDSATTTPGFETQEETTESLRIKTFGNEQDSVNTTTSRSAISEGTKSTTINSASASGDVPTETSIEGATTVKTVSTTLKVIPGDQAGSLTEVQETTEGNRMRSNSNDIINDNSQDSSETTTGSFSAELSASIKSSNIDPTLGINQNENSTFDTHELGNAKTLNGSNTKQISKAPKISNNLSEIKESSDEVLDPTTQSSFVKMQPEGNDVSSIVPETTSRTQKSEVASDGNAIEETISRPSVTTKMDADIGNGSDAHHPKTTETNPRNLDSTVAGTINDQPNDSTEPSAQPNGTEIPASKSVVDTTPVPKDEPTISRGLEDPEVNKISETSTSSSNKSNDETTTEGGNKTSVLTVEPSLIKNQLEEATTTAAATGNKKLEQNYDTNFSEELPETTENVLQLKNSGAKSEEILGEDSTKLYLGTIANLQNGGPEVTTTSAVKMDSDNSEKTFDKKNLDNEIALDRNTTTETRQALQSPPKELLLNKNDTTGISTTKKFLPTLADVNTTSKSVLQEETTDWVTKNQTSTQSPDDTNPSGENESEAQTTTKLPLNLSTKSEDPVILALEKWKSEQATQIPNNDEDTTGATVRTFDLSTMAMFDKSSSTETPTLNVQEIITPTTTEGVSVTSQGSFRSDDVAIETTTEKRLTKDEKNPIEKSVNVVDNIDKNNSSEVTDRNETSTTNPLEGAIKTFPVASSTDGPTGTERATTKDDEFITDDVTEQFSTSGRPSSVSMTDNKDEDIPATTLLTNLLDANSKNSEPTKIVSSSDAFTSRSVVRMGGSSTSSNKGARQDNAEEISTGMPTGTLKIQELISETTEGASVTSQRSFSSDAVPKESTTEKLYSKDEQNSLEKPASYDDNNENNSSSQATDGNEASTINPLEGAVKTFPVSSSKNVPTEIERTTTGADELTADDVTEQFVTSSRPTSVSMTDNKVEDIPATTLLTNLLDADSKNETSEPTKIPSSSDAFTSRSVVRMDGSSTSSNKGVRLENAEEISTGMPTGMLKIQEIIASDTTEGASVTLPGSSSSNSVLIETTTEKRLAEEEQNSIEKPANFDNKDKNNSSETTDQNEPTINPLEGAVVKTFPASSSTIFSTGTERPTSGADELTTDEVTANERFTTSGRPSSVSVAVTENPEEDNAAATVLTQLLDNNSNNQISEPTKIVSSSDAFTSRSVVRMGGSSTSTNKEARLDIAEEMTTDKPNEIDTTTNSTEIQPDEKESNSGNKSSFGGLKIIEILNASTNHPVADLPVPETSTASQTENPRNISEDDATTTIRTEEIFENDISKTISGRVLNLEKQQDGSKDITTARSTTSTEVPMATAGVTQVSRHATTSSMSSAGDPTLSSIDSEHSTEQIAETTKPAVSSERPKFNPSETIIDEQEVAIATTEPLQRAQLPISTTEGTISKTTLLSSLDEISRGDEDSSEGAKPVSTTPNDEESSTELPNASGNAAASIRRDELSQERATSAPTEANIIGRITARGFEAATEFVLTTVSAILGNAPEDTTTVSSINLADQLNEGKTPPTNTPKSRTLFGTTVSPNEGSTDQNIRKELNLEINEILDARTDPTGSEENIQLTTSTEKPSGEPSTIISEASSTEKFTEGPNENTTPIATDDSVSVDAKEIVTEKINRSDLKINPTKNQSDTESSTVLIETILEGTTEPLKSTTLEIGATSKPIEVQTTSKTKFQLDKAILSVLSNSSESHSEDSPSYDVDVDVTLSQPDFPAAAADLIEKEVQSISKEQSRTEKAVSKTLVSKSEHISDDYPMYDVEVTIPHPDPAESADLIEKESHTISKEQARTEKAISVSKVKTSISEHPPDKPNQVFYEVEVNVSHPDFTDYSGETSDNGVRKQIRVLNLNRATPAPSVGNIEGKASDAPSVGQSTLQSGDAPSLGQSSIKQPEAPPSMEKNTQGSSESDVMTTTDQNTMQPDDAVENVTEEFVTGSPKVILSLAPNPSLWKQIIETYHPRQLFSSLNNAENQDSGRGETTTEETSVTEKILSWLGVASSEADDAAAEINERTDAPGKIVFAETTQDTLTADIEILSKSTDTSTVIPQNEPNPQSEVSATTSRIEAEQTTLFKNKKTTQKNIHGSFKNTDISEEFQETTPSNSDATSTVPAKTIGLIESVTNYVQEKSSAIRNMLFEKKPQADATLELSLNTEYPVDESSTPYLRANNKEILETTGADEITGTSLVKETTIPSRTEVPVEDSVVSFITEKTVLSRSQEEKESIETSTSQELSALENHKTLSRSLSKSSEVFIEMQLRKNTGSETTLKSSSAEDTTTKNTPDDVRLGSEEVTERSEVVATTTISKGIFVNSQKDETLINSMASSEDATTVSSATVKENLPTPISTPRSPIVFTGGRVRHQGARNLVLHVPEVNKKPEVSTKPAPHYIRTLVRKQETTSTTSGTTKTVETSTATLSETTLFEEGTASPVDEDSLESEDFLGVEAGAEVDFEDFELGSKPNREETAREVMGKQMPMRGTAYRVQAAKFTLPIVVTLIPFVVSWTLGQEF